MFRRIFLINGCVMIVVGMLLWGWPNLFAPSPAIPLSNTVTVTDEITPKIMLLIDGSVPVMVFPKNEKPIFLGGSLIALGVASLAIGNSRRTTLQRKAALYFLAGHLFLGFTVWTLMPGWPTFAGFIVFDLLIWPIPAFLYGILPYRSVEASQIREMSSTEQEIREAAGQEERNRLFGYGCP